MADVKGSALPTSSTFEADDWVTVTKDVGGTPSTVRMNRQTITGKVVTGANGDGPNITHGHSTNEIRSDISAATISGGGQTNFNNVIGGDGTSTVNTATPNASLAGTGAHYSVITGGYDNVAGGLASIISGFHNMTGTTTTHGTVAGGADNRITAGAYGTVGGGRANRLSGNDAVVAGGNANTASGTQASVGGGFTNTASGLIATVGGGQNNAASATSSTVVGGRENVASGASSVAMGREAKAYTEGQVAHASGKFAANGDAQRSLMVVRRETTDATLSLLGYNGAAATIQLQQDSSALIRVQVVARDTSNGDSKAWSVECLVTNDTATAVSFIGGAPSMTVVAADAGASTWTATLTSGADSFGVNVSGEAAKTIRWVGSYELLEVVG